MSLIFKALQRFDSPEATQSERTKGLPPKRNALTLSKLLLSPSIALSAAAAIFVVGLVVSQAINYLSHKAEPITPTVQAAIPEQTVPSKPSAQKSFKVDADAEPQDAEPQIDQPIAASDAQKVSFQVHPPEPDTASTANNPSASDAIRFQFVDSDNRSEEDGVRSAEKSSFQSQTAALDSKQKGVLVDSPDSIQTENDADAASSSKVLSFVRYAASPAELPKSEHGSEDASSVVSAHPAKRSDENLQYQRQVDQATKHLQVSQLTQQIHGAIEADDVRLTSNLLDKLARIKGADNPFVLKLKAFSLIRQDRLEEARTLLTTVLTNSAEDREAGLNMAVIDMKLGRLDSAQQRLYKLREIFPEDTNITRYLRKLPN